MNPQCIVINRKQQGTQSPSAYVSYFVESESIEEVRGAFALSDSSQIVAPAFRVIVQNEDINIKNWRGKLLTLNNLKDGWNGYSAPAPSQNAILIAYEFVDTLTREKAEPTRLAPSAVGGIGVTHRKFGRKTYVEFYNDGRVFVMFSDGESEPIVKQVEPGHQSFKALISEMQEYLDARDSR